MIIIRKPRQIICPKEKGEGLELDEPFLDFVNVIGLGFAEREIMNEVVECHRDEGGRSERQVQA